MIVSLPKSIILTIILDLLKYDNPGALSEIVRFEILIQFIRNISYKNSLKMSSSSTQK